MITTGCYVASYGPLIPFFAAVTHLDQTHYAYLFLVRASANVIGSLLLKKIAPIVPVRRLLLLLCTGLAVALTVSTFSLSTLNLVLTFFVASICIVMLNIVIVSFNFAAFSPEEGTHHIQVLGFVFGAGAMAAPFVVMYLQLSTYLLLALLCLGLAPLYLTQ
jgi:MFS family permease